MNQKLLVLFLIFTIMTFTLVGYAATRQGARTNAVPKPIPGFQQADYPSLVGGFIAETRNLSKVHSNRGLVLWIAHAVKKEMTTEYESCPDEMTGSCYGGQIYASLLDLKTHQVIQTVFFDMDGEEGDSLPYRIPPGLFSTHGIANALGEKKTVLLDPVEIDMDPTCEEYAFFESPGGCFCPAVFPFGYDSVADKIFRFKEVDYRMAEDGDFKRWEGEVMSDLFFQIDRFPDQKSYDFSSSIGHGSEVFTLHRYKYDRKLRTFYGVDEDIPDDDKHNGLYFDQNHNLGPAAHRFLDNVWKKFKPQSANHKN